MQFQNCSHHFQLNKVNSLNFSRGRKRKEEKKIMKPFQLMSKTQSLSRLTNIVLISSSVCILYLIVSVFLLGSSSSSSSSSTSSSSVIKTTLHNSAVSEVYAPTSLDHIVFGIAGNNHSWPKRKEYVKLWWKPHRMRGCVFLECPPPDLKDKNENTTSSSQLPPVCISQDTSKFRYTYRGSGGLKSAIRVARVVLETVKLNHSDVRWFVFGDDDTVFFPENLVKTLSKYDHRLWYYIGTNSEIYEQNRFFRFGMAFGGAGFAISYPLAKVLAKFFDSCIQRYPHLYGSDSRIHSCLAELGVGLTREPGFHQFDVRGNVFGLLAAHPITPPVSIHHLDHLDPIFPNMTSIKALKHLFQPANLDEARILQQTVCYDRWFSWTISVSWGYAVQVFGKHIHLPEVLPVQETFRQWKQHKGNVLAKAYTFNTKEVHPDPCERPTVFFLDSVSSDRDGIIRSTYKKSFQNCSRSEIVYSPRKLEEIRVFSKKLELDIKQLQAPRRHCCDILPTSAGKQMDIALRECKEEELIHMS